MLNSQRWADIDRLAAPMIISTRRKTTQKATYAEAATETMIMVGNVFGSTACRKKNGGLSEGHGGSVAGKGLVGAEN